MDEKLLIRKLIEEFARSGEAQDDEVKVIRVQDRKTTYVESNGDGGRSIMMSEYQIDGKTYWAGYSLRSRTVYISLAG